MPAKTKEKLPTRRAAERVLLDSPKPLHYRDVARLANERGLIKAKPGKRKVDEKATEKTVRSYLCEREGERFVRVRPGVFKLSTATRQALRRAEKADAAARKAREKAST